jgi:hypothetical protein
VAYNEALNVQGPIVSGNCTDDGVCSAKITGLGVLGATSFLTHVYDYYDPSHLDIIANDGTIKISNGQAKIDVTGRARNVLKRLQVRMPINQIGATDSQSLESRANFAAEAQVICKRIKTNQSGTSFDPPAVNDLNGISIGNINDLCTLTN